MPLNEISIFRALAATVFVGALSVQAFAGFGDEEFEDHSETEIEEENWPEVEFPNLAERGAGFRLGERFEYRAQWGVFRKAGKIVIETKSDSSLQDSEIRVDTNTSSAGLIRTFYPMTLSATTVVDTEHWRLLSNEVDGHTRSEPNQTLTVIDYDSNTLTFTDKAEPEHDKKRALPYPTPLDYSGSLLQLRGYNLEIGGKYPVFVTTKGKFYYVEMTVTELEEQKTAFGTRECFRIEPVSAYPQSKLFREGGKMSIWVTNDDERLPVRFDVKTSVGTASIRLDDYKSDTGLKLTQR